MPLTPDTPLTAVRGIGPARGGAFAAAGYSTVRDLLFHLPHRYEDRRAVTPVGEVGAAGEVTVRGRLLDLKAVRVRRRGLALVRGAVEDDSGRLAVVWFNRPYLTTWADSGEEYLLHGPVRATKSGALALLNPSCERAAAALHGGRIAPVYPAVRGVGPAALRRLLPQLLAALDLPRLADPLPPDLLDRHGLPPLAEALAVLHAPPEGADLDALNGRHSPAHLRLIYGELLELQLELAVLRERAVREPRRHHYRIDDRLRQTARAALPFKLTAAQKRVLREIAADLQSPYPMLRLLQGDVGSGKTIVAALALLIALENSDLANGIGNLASRSLSMIVKNCDGQIPECGPLTEEDKAMLASADALHASTRDDMNTLMIHRALTSIIAVVSEADRYFASQEPWALKKTDPARMATVLYVTADVVRQIAILLQPFMPELAGKLLDLVAVAADKRDFASLGKAGRLVAGTALEAPKPVFPRYVAPEA